MKKKNSDQEFFQSDRVTAQMTSRCTSTPDDDWRDLRDGYYPALSGWNKYISRKSVLHRDIDTYSA